MDKRSIDIRLKNIFERYENIVNSKAPYSFELEIMYIDALSFTPVITRAEQQSRDLNYLKSRISEAMKSQDIQAFRMRKVNGKLPKAMADNWEEFILRENKPAAPAAPEKPQNQFNGFAGFEIDGQPLTPHGLAGLIENKIGEATRKYEQENIRNSFELQKIQELTNLNQQIFKLEFQKKYDDEKIITLEKRVLALENEVEELESEIEELEEQAGEVETLREKASKTHAMSKALGYAASNLVKTKAPHIADGLAGLFGLSDDEDSTEPTTEAAAPPPPPVAQAEPEPTDEKSQKIAALTHWFKQLNNEAFERVLQINIAMSKSVDLMNDIDELIKN